MDNSLILSIQINIQPAAPSQITFPIKVNVLPALPVFSPDNLSVKTTIIVNPIPLPLSQVIFSSLDALLGNQIDNFFDDTRELKTLLNFGNDYQEVITNWKYDSINDGNIIDVKLYRPLTPLVDVKQQLWITREVTPPVIDNLYVVYTPTPGQLVYLRPPNRNIDIVNQSGQGIQTVTQNTLYTSSFFNLVSQNDPIVNQWYNIDFNSSDLNIDYSDYRNFVFYSSAASRLNAFMNKLLLIENINSILLSNSSSLARTGSAHITGTVTYPVLQNLAADRINIIRSFDGYEQFLYYQSGSAYSSSLETSDWQDQIYYHSDSTWPKVNGVISSVASATLAADVQSMSPNPPAGTTNNSWYENQLWIAEQYDLANPNYMKNNLPEFLSGDSNSIEYIRFFDLVGHIFDQIKSYIDHSTDMWNRDNNPLLGLSPDLIWNVAKSFGLDLPNQYSINSLIDYTIGRIGQVSPKIYHQIAAETWKRFLHNQIFLMKSKGTKTSLRALSNVFGILPTTLQIKETSTPSFTYPTGTFEIFEEQTNTLNLAGSGSITLPWSSSAVQTNTIELRFNATLPISGVLLNGDNKWALTINPLTGSWARVILMSGSTPTVSSSYFEMYSGNYYNVMIRYNASGMQLGVIRADNDQIIESSLSQETGAKVSSVWFSPYNVFLGGSGSFFGQHFIGTIDEFRMWGEVLSDSTFQTHARYSGMYSGNTNSSAANSLYVRLSFNKPVNLGTTKLPNETPYIRNSGVTGSLLSFTATGFPNVATYPYNMVTVIRKSQRYTLNSGGSQFATNKITIVPPATLRYVDINGSGSLVPVLSHNRSMVSYEEKKQTAITANNTIGFFFSVAEAINDSIVRSLGNISIQNLIGDPADLYKEYYTSLMTIDNLYWSNYAYNFNINTFVDFVDDLLEPLFAQARNLVPARSHMLSGIVHEPHILERAKVKNSPPKVEAGQYTRATRDMVNLEAPAIDYQAKSPVGDYETLLAKVSNITSSLHVSSINPQYSTTINTTRSLATTAFFNDYNVKYATVTTRSIDMSFKYYDNSANMQSKLLELLSAFGPGITNIYQLNSSQRALVNSAMSSYKPASTIQVYGTSTITKTTYESNVTQSVVIFPILPYSDFDHDIASYTYFTNPQSLVGVAGYTEVRYKQEILNSKGNWSNGAPYSRNDYVVQVTSSLDAANPGNGNEFVCITTNANFISNLPPYLDTANWAAQRYVAQSALFVKEAILINGKVSIAPTGSTYPGVIGYQPQHYKFTRDKRKRVLRGLFLGCLQDNTTTSDGLPPVQEFTSAGDILTVRNPGTPIQQSDNQSGPILDVS